jgi:hypothetical protein
VVGHVVVVETAAVAGRNAGVVHEQVREQEWHTGQRRLGHRAHGGRSGLLVQGVDDGVGVGIERLDAADRLLYQLGRGDVSAPDEGGQGDGVVLGM